MPAHAPDWMTNNEERELYRDISRLYEDYLASDESQWEDRKRSFLDVVSTVQSKLDPFPCMNCAGTCENISTEVGGVNWKCPRCGWEPITVTEGVGTTTAIYASENVTDTLAHVVAVLKETQRQPDLPMEASIVKEAIDEGVAVVEILRGKHPGPRE
jgi:predicted RNA-binding Zn-ribbon protein involved in translation (DUF1610 family)